MLYGKTRSVVTLARNRSRYGRGFYCLRCAHDRNLPEVKPSPLGGHMASVRKETKRAMQYVETTAENLTKKIQEVIAGGMAYDIEILKGGKPVQNVPSAVAAALVTIGMLPRVRVATLIGGAVAGLAGYTFR